MWHITVGGFQSLMHETQMEGDICYGVLQLKLYLKITFSVQDETVEDAESEMRIRISLLHQSFCCNQNL
jgi:hypothetical protein